MTIINWSEVVRLDEWRCRVEAAKTSLCNVEISLQFCHPRLSLVARTAVIIIACTSTTRIGREHAEMRQEKLVEEEEDRMPFEF